LRGLEVGGCGALLEGRQLGGDGGSHELWLLCHGLAEFDEQTAGVLEGHPQRPPESGSRDLAIGTAMQEPSVDPDPADLQVSEDPRGQGAGPTDRVREPAALSPHSLP
jgi:hypothetical protein